MSADDQIIECPHCTTRFTSSEDKNADVLDSVEVTIAGIIRGNYSDRLLVELPFPTLNGAWPLGKKLQLSEVPT